MQLKTGKMVKSIQFIARQGLSGRSWGNDARTRFFCSRRITWEPTEIVGIVGESNFQKRRWSHAAASVPSDTSNNCKGNKKVSKEERRAMVESFVNKFRAMNAGKFPPISIAKEEVGGSYYTIRELIQELEYKSKGCSSTNSPTDKNIEANVGLQSSFAVENTHEEALVAGDPDCNFDHNKMEKRLLEEKSKIMDTLNEESPESDDFSIKEHQSGHTNFVAPDNLLKKEVNAKHPPCRQESIDVDEKGEGTQFDFFCNINTVTKGETNKAQCSEFNETEYNKQQKASFENQSGFSGQDHIEEQHHGFIDKPEPLSGNSSSRESDADIQKKPTLWGNFKSFADSIMSLWKKL